MSDIVSLNIAAFLACAYFLLAGAHKVISLRKLTEKPEKPDPTPPYHKQFADREETERRFAALEARVDEIPGSIHELEIRLREASSARVKDIHNRFERLASGVDRLTGEVQARFPKT